MFLSRFNKRLFGRPRAAKREHIYILPNKTGMLYVLMVFLLFYLGFFSQQSNIVFLAFCLLAFVVTGMLQTNYNLSDIQVLGVTVPPVAAGEEGQVVLLLSCPGNHHGYALHVQALLGTTKIAGFIDCLPKQGVTELTLTFPPQRRGVYRLSELQVSSVFPIGLFRAWKPLSVTHRCIVYPRPAGKWPIPKGGHDIGDQEGRAAAYGEDFWGHRAYLPGDSQRRIDWKARARGMPLLIKEFEMPLADVQVLQWRDLQHMDVESRLSQLAQWVVQCHEERRSYSLLLPSVTIPAGMGRKQFIRCMRALARFREK